MALTKEMQDVLDSLKGDLQEQDINRDSVLKRLEETRTRINRFYDEKAEEFNNKDYTEMSLDASGNEIQNKIQVSLNPDEDNETKRLKLEQAYNKVDSANNDKYSFDKERYEQRKKEYDEKLKSNPKLATNPKFRAPKEPTTLSSGFQKSLQSAVKANEQKQINLKKEAETILKIKSKLIENAQKIAAKMKAEMDSITSKKEEVKKQLEDIKNNIAAEEKNRDNIQAEMDKIKEEIKDKEEESNKYNEDWKAKLAEAQSKKEELQDAINTGKPNEEVERLRSEFATLSDECVKMGDLSDKALRESEDLKKEYDKKENIDLKNSMQNITALNGDRIAKEDELKSIPDSQTYEMFFKELENIKGGLDKSLEKDIQTFTDKFSEVGIDITEEDIQNEELAETENEKEAEDKKDKKDKSVGNAIVSGDVGTQEDLEENGLLDISNRKDSNYIADKFMNASLEEQERFLKYYGYEDLAKSGEHLGPFARGKLAKCLEEHFRNNIPEPVDFLQAVTSVSGSNINYRKFFDKDNKPLMFNKLDIETLREIQHVISDFNANKANMSKDEIEFFDKNFMTFIKNGTLLQNIKTGRIRGFFQGFSNRSTVRKNILNAMSSYTRENADNISRSEGRSNKLRERLGLQTKSPSDSIDETRLNNKKRTIDDPNR